MSTTTDLHGIVAEHVAAVNAQDEDAIVATFGDDAFVRYLDVTVAENTSSPSR